LIGADVAEKRFGIHNKNAFQILLIPFLLHGFYDFCTLFASAYFAARGEYWILFLPFFSLVTVVVGFSYARKRRLQILQMEAHYVPMTTMAMNV
jgi:hypothetical protein